MPNRRELFRPKLFASSSAAAGSVAAIALTTLFMT